MGCMNIYIHTAVPPVVLSLNLAEHAAAINKCGVLVIAVEIKMMVERSPFTNILYFETLRRKGILSRIVA